MWSATRESVPGLRAQVAEALARVPVSIGTQAGMDVVEEESLAEVDAAPTQTGVVPATQHGAAGTRIQGDSPLPTDRLEGIICSFSWPCGEALAIIACESGFDPYEVGPYRSRGLMMIHPVHAWRFERLGWDYWTDVFVPERNLAIAAEIYAEQGWRPWTCA